MKIFIMLLIFSTTIYSAEISFTVLKFKGNAQIREGMNEKWQPVQVGQILREMDSVVTGSDAEISVLRSDGFKTIIPEECLLEVFELVLVSEQDLILFLTGEKLREIKPLHEKRDLKLSPIHVIHGEKYETPETDSTLLNVQIAALEMNGVQMLMDLEYFTNAIIKLRKIKRIYPNKIDLAQAEFQEAICFESIQHYGNAIAVFEKIVRNFSESEYSELAEKRMKGIKAVYLKN